MVEVICPSPVAQAFLLHGTMCCLSAAVQTSLPTLLCLSVLIMGAVEDLQSLLSLLGAAQGSKGRGFTPPTWLQRAGPQSVHKTIHVSGVLMNLNNSARMRAQ